MSPLRVLHTSLALCLLLVACDRSFLHGIPSREPETPPETTCAPDGSPTSLSAQAGESGVLLSFADGATNEDGLTVERRASIAEAWVEMARLGPNSERYLDQEVVHDQSLQYRLKAYRIVNSQWCESLPSSVVGTTTLPNPPANFETGGVSDNTQILLLWSDTNELETGYRLERRDGGLTDEGSFAVVAELPPNSTTFTDTLRTPGATYDYRLAAVNPSGASRPVTLTARASAAPSLSWGEAPFLEAGSCHLMIAAEASFDDELGAEFVSSTGTVEKSSDPVVSSAHHLEATLDDLTPGPFSVSWSVVDSLGSESTLVRDLSLDVAAAGRTVARPRAPSGVLGEDNVVGQQATLPGCANCTGRRGSISTGSYMSCSLGEDGGPMCWGTNAYGNLGNGEGFVSTTFVAPCQTSQCLGPLSDVVAVSVSSELACAILGSGEARCWADSAYDGELGNGDFATSTGTPVPVCASGKESDGTCVRRSDFRTSGRQTIGVAKDLACALTQTGTSAGAGVVCWGSNDEGALGMGGTPGSATKQANPVEVCVSGSRANNDCVPLRDAIAVAVSSSYEFVCAQMLNGRVRCWGDNYYEHLGVGGRSAIPWPYNLSTARYEVCAEGSVGNGTCVPLEGVTQLAVGGGSSCAIIAGGRVRCWGYAGPQMGLAGAAYSSYADGYGASNPVPVCAGGTFSKATRTCSDSEGNDTALDEAIELGAGSSHTCVITGADRQVLCWGANPSGQLGDGTEIDRTVPGPVCRTGSVGDGTCVPLVGASRLEVRHGATCVDVDGTTLCWGGNIYGELGHGDLEEHLNPVAVCAEGKGDACRPVRGIIQVAQGDRALCVVTTSTSAVGQSESRRLSCVGANQYSLLGRGSYSRRLTAGKVCLSGSKWECVPPRNVLSLTSGDRHTCMIREDSSLWCFGYNGAGQLGLGTHQYQEAREAPVPVCASGKFDGSRCVDGEVPSPLDHVVSAAAGMHHTCVVLDNGQPLCFGLNNCGQLGNGQSGNCNDPNPNGDYYVDASLAGYLLETLPTPLCARGGATQPCEPMTGGVASAAAGQLHSCLLLQNGEAMCFGRNDTGQLGTGEPSPVYSNPVRVCASSSGSGCPALGGIVQLSLGNRHSCALLNDGTARCWGENGRGQLGDGTTTTPRLTPVPVCRSGFGATCDPLSGIVAITSGDHFSCALLDSQEVYCWGSNEAKAGDGFVGTLGAGTSITHTTLPMRVCEPNPSTPCDEVPSSCRALQDAVAISAKQSHACAARADGSVVCWGDSASWGIGIGSVRATDYCAPVQVCTDGVDANCPTPLAEQAVRTCDLLEVNVVENP